jgi:FAD-dependent urate hydroxylase
VDIAILGAGVAGISSAIALKQKGFDVNIYERCESVSTIGAGIVVWPNAAYVLEQFGVLDEIKDVSGYPKRMRRLSNINEALGAIDIEIINHNMGYPSLSILRNDLQNILASRLKSLDVSIQYGHTVTSIETKISGNAEVHFQNGAKVTTDAVIGADGRMASIARRYVHGDNSPVYQGFINWIGVYNSEEDTFPELDIKDYWGVGERFGIVPVTRRKAYWAGGAACKEIGLRNPDESKTELRSIFSNWPEPVRKMIEQTPIERINKIYVHDHDPVETWHRNNVIMIGDAAHAPLPTSGQGACQALEDAWHLANCLYKNTDNLQQAYNEFTEIRFEKTANITMAARHLASSLFNSDESFCRKRNEDSRKTDYSKVAVAMSRGWSLHLPLNA